MDKVFQKFLRSGIDLSRSFHEIEEKINYNVSKFLILH